MIFKFDESKAGKDAPENLIMNTIAITGDYQESDNPHRNIPEVIAAQMPELHKQSEKGTIQIIKKLEKLIEKYPKVPALYNYLSIAYMKQGNITKFEKINELAINRFPNYPVTRINQATRHIIRDEFDKAEAILGHNMELSAFLPNRQVYHLSEVVQFYETTVRFFIHKRAFDVADSRLDMLRGISKAFDGFHKEKIEQLEREKADELEILQDENYKKYTIKAVRKEWVAKSNTQPTFTHPEIQWLYQHGFDIPKEKIDTLLALPRPTLIADLHKVLDDAMARFDHFYNEEWDGDTFNFPSHALFLLAELRATESLNYALNFLRQDNEWADYWFGDMITETLPILYYKMIGDDFSILKNYLLEPKNEPFQRMVITTAVAMIAYYHPEKRQKCIAFLEDMLNDFYEHLNQYKNIIDIEIVETIVSDLGDLESKDSFPLIEKLYWAGLMSGLMSGDIEEIKAVFFGDEKPICQFPKILNIFETYQDILYWDNLNAQDDDDADKSSGIISGARNNWANDVPSPIKNEPKAGRNDPCPCGSGKKYKKCHGA